MSLASVEFAIFVAALLVPYRALSAGGQNWWLLAASYVFYASFGWPLPVLLFAVTGFNYLAGKAVARGVRSVLWLAVGADVGMLAALKIAAAGSTIVPLAPDTTPSAVPMLVWPIGLSFYVLGVISYLVDVGRRPARAASSFRDFALYVAYFPKLLSGPIERAISFLPPLEGRRAPDGAEIERSVNLIMLGLFRKCVIADSLAAYFDEGLFAPPLAASPAGILGDMLMFQFVIYNDFAGYSDLVRGVSGLFGIQLSENFRRPFFARSFSDLWMRWHVSLSSWLRDYVYLPVTRSLLRADPDPRRLSVLFLPPLVTMTASGLWHALSIGPVVWGVLVGVLQGAGQVRAVGRDRTALARQPAWRRGVAALVTTILCSLILVPFRMDLGAALDTWTALAAWPGPIRPYPFATLLIAVSLAIDAVQERAGDDVPFVRWPRVAHAAVLAVAALAIFLATRAPARPFVYQGF
ncbi:MAG: MBOAT family O-acyltransferase [Candidatus Binatia bacterium]